MPTRRGADIAQGWYGLNAVAALLALAHPVVAPGLSVAGATDAPTGVAASPTWYAYDDGLAPSPAPTCPRIADPLEQCSLAEALALAHGGGTVELAGPGPGPRYVGNWDVSPAPGAPLTIKPAPGVQHPVLDGNGGRATGCPTVSCSGPVLKIGSRARGAGRGPYRDQRGGRQPAGGQRRGDRECGGRRSGHRRLPVRRRPGLRRRRYCQRHRRWPQGLGGSRSIGLGLCRQPGQRRRGPSTTVMARAMHKPMAWRQ